MIDLFSGIGGFSLAASWVWGRDLDIKFFCECDSFCQKVLHKHWPDVPIIEDVRDVKNEFETVDIITGGFPCQDISQAKTDGQQGIDGERSGLWKEYFRIICLLRPRYAIVENVSALLYRGMFRVLGDLASIGYSAEWETFPASTIGCPHRRERTWIVAHTNGNRLLFPMSYRRIKETFGQEEPFWGQYWDEVRAGFTGYEAIPLLEEAKKEAMDKPWLCRVVDGPSQTMDRLKSLGNAIVPQIAEVIFRVIKEVEKNMKFREF